MKKNKNKIDITSFSDYKKVSGQYTDSFIKGSRCVKFDETESEVFVIVSEGFKKNTKILDEVHSGRKVELISVKDSDFAEFIGNCVDLTFDIKKKADRDVSGFRLEDINNDAPIVNTINAICLEAIRRQASDIHIQSEKEFVNVRMRIDGVLQNIRQLDKKIFDSLVSRIKVMSGLNVMENRLCQDGRMSVVAEGKKLDFRVSVVPAVTGQNIVLRLFNAENEDLTLEELGFSKNNLKRINGSLNLPYGMILATGPTGSGKSTTLHAMLKEMDREHLKIVTIEDPVEKMIEGVEQIQVNSEIGLTFESVLRRILRQDPDVIMVGEIRDRETAELAVRSALTGHLILSTIHTNDSISVITRLKNLGIEPYLISSVLRLSIAQRLVRKICSHCKGKGCEECSSTGYKGRTAVSEVFYVDDAVAQKIEKNATDAEIRKFVLTKDFVTMKTDALSKIKASVTTKKEILREGLV